MIEYSESLLSRVVPQGERDYAKALTQAYANAVIALDKTRGVYTRSRLQGVINSITEELTTINKAYAEVLPYQSENILEGSIKYTEEELALALKHASIQATLFTIPKDMIQEFTSIKGINYYRIDSKGVRHTSSTTAEHLLKTISKNNSKKIKSIILAEASTGSSPEKIARLIRPYVTTNIKRDVRTVTRSLIGEANERASQKFYTENSKYIEEYLYIATLDSKTSRLCQSLDGRRFKTREPHYTPKLHPNCRSSLVAVPQGYVGSQRPIVLKDGTVEIVDDKNFTFADALKRYPDLNDKGLINVDEYLKKLKV